MLRNSLQYRLNFYILYVFEYKYNSFSLDVLANAYRSFFSLKNFYRIKEKFNIIR